MPLTLEVCQLKRAFSSTGSENHKPVSSSASCSGQAEILILLQKCMGKCNSTDVHKEVKKAGRQLLDVPINVLLVRDPDFR